MTTTVSETVTEMETVAAGLPAPVEETRAAILAAAEAGDPETVAALAAPQFSYSFGGPVEGGPAAYWQMLEEQGEQPLETLAAILRLPYTLANGIYVWPFAYDKQAEDLTGHERELLGDLADDFVPGTGYLGWRAGIEPDGDWIFFVAGD